MHYMELGGAERALLGLLYAIDTDKVDVDLMINQHTGPFMQLIPKKVNLLPEIPAYSVIESSMQKVFKKKQWGVLLGRLQYKVCYTLYKKIHRLTNDGTATHFLYDSVNRFLPSLKHLGCYDLAISFLDPPHIVQDKIDAKVKVEWIHTDFSGGNFHYDTHRTLSRWAANDHIISISESVTQSFIKAFPELKEKIVEIENIIPKSLVLEQSLVGNADEYEGCSGVIKICSVGRLSHQKNFECIPAVAQLLVSSGLSFHWWIVGPGDIFFYNNLAQEYGVDACVSYIGPKDNPYPYMRQCDIYVQPSRYEGKAVTVQEAQMLARPVIITNYPTSSSQIIDGKDGIICELNNEAIADAIMKLSSKVERMKTLGENAAQMHAGNDCEVEKIYRILGI